MFLGNETLTSEKPNENDNERDQWCTLYPIIVAMNRCIYESINCMDGISGVRMKQGREALESLMVIYAKNQDATKLNRAHPKLAPLFDEINEFRKNHNDEYEKWAVVQGNGFLYLVCNNIARKNESVKAVDDNCKQ